MKLIYKEKVEFYVASIDQRSSEGLDYKGIIRINDSKKFPVNIDLKFIGIRPFALEMAPEEHSIKARDIIDLYLKLNRFFKKYGYVIK